MFRRIRFHRGNDQVTPSSAVNLTLPVIPFSQIKYDADQKPLGEGSFSTVYLGEFKQQQVAIKRFKSLMEERRTEVIFEAEKTIMQTLGQHPHVVFSYGVSSFRHCNHLVLEYMPGGDLSSYLYAHPRDDDQEQIRQNIALGVGKALAYLWRQGIIHRDIKSENILLDERQHAKIADFGLAVQVNRETQIYTTYGTVGSLGWLPPEAFAQDIAHPAICTETYDIWAYATLLWVLSSYHKWTSFAEIEDPTILAQYAREGITPTLDQNTSPECRALLTRCWNKDPKQRPNAQEIVTLLEGGMKLASTPKAK